jgi:hypothetical protein
LVDQLDNPCEQREVSFSSSHDDPDIVQEVVEETLRQVDNATAQVSEYREAVGQVESFLRTIEIDDALSQAQLVSGNSVENGTVTRFPIVTSETGDEAFAVVVAGLPLRVTIDGEAFQDVDTAKTFLANEYARATHESRHSELPRSRSIECVLSSRRTASVSISPTGGSAPAVNSGKALISSISISCTRKASARDNCSER